MPNHSYEQMSAIEHYKAKLAEIDDLETLRQYALNNYRQTLSTHNTYRYIINHHISIEEILLADLAEK